MLQYGTLPVKLALASVVFKEFHIAHIYTLSPVAMATLTTPEADCAVLFLESKITRTYLKIV
jgi:hypothetical protein